MDPLVSAVVAGFFALFAAIISAAVVLIKNGGDRRTALEARLDKRIDDALAEQSQTIKDQAEEISKLKAQMRAVGRVLRATAAVDPQGPDINPEDIKLLEDSEVLPPAWIRRPPTN